MSMSLPTFYVHVPTYVILPKLLEACPPQVREGLKDFVLNQFTSYKKTNLTRFHRDSRWEGNCVGGKMTPSMSPSFIRGDYGVPFPFRPKGLVSPGVPSWDVAHAAV